MKKKTKSQNRPTGIFEGFSANFQDFVNESIVFCINETENKSTAEQILRTTKGHSDYSKIKEVYKSKF